MSRYELMLDIIARWIYEESIDSIEEIEFLLKNAYDKVEDLEEEYRDVIEHQSEFIYSNPRRGKWVKE